MSSIARVKDLVVWRKLAESPLAQARRQVKMAAREKGLISLSALYHTIRVDPSGNIYDLNYFQRAEALVSKYFHLSEKELIRSAFSMAYEGHKGQVRESGEPYLEHPLWVAEILAEWGFGAEAVAAGLCHDLIEDGRIAGNRITENYFKENFGERIALLIGGVTELGKEPGSKGKPHLVEIYKKLIECGHKDLLIFIIKLADRLHNMRTLAYTSPDKRRKKAEETLKVYCRIADILGMWEVKRELEDLSFKYTDAGNFNVIENKRAQIINESRERFDWKTNLLRRKLKENQGIEVYVLEQKLDRAAYRKILDKQEELKRKEASPGKLSIDYVIIIKEQRAVYELYERMIRRGKRLDQLTWSDVYRLNVVVPRREDCHSISGYIQDNLFPPDQNDIRNYIAEPRTNGHRFLYFYGKARDFGNLLIQVRDLEMYWNYQMGSLTKISEGKLALSGDSGWLNALKELLAGEGVSEEEFYDAVAAHSRSIYVYNAGGRRIQLPYGSTVLDFALLDHEPVSEPHFSLFGERSVGVWKMLIENDCISEKGEINPSYEERVKLLDLCEEDKGKIIDILQEAYQSYFLHAESAIINDNPASLRQVLNDGEVVKINKGAQARPDLGWLRWMREPEQLRKYLQNRQTRRQIVRSAFVCLEQESMKYYLPTKKLLRTRLFRKYLVSRGFDKLMPFLYQVGIGALDYENIIKEFIGYYQKTVDAEKEKTLDWAVIVKVKDREGLLGEIAGGIAKLKLNITEHKSNHDRKGATEIIFVVRCAKGLSREVQKIQMLNIIATTPDVETVEPYYGLIQRMKRYFKKE